VTATTSSLVIERTRLTLFGEAFTGGTINDNARLTVRNYLTRRDDARTAFADADDDCMVTLSGIAKRRSILKSPVIGNWPSGLSRWGADHALSDSVYLRARRTALTGQSVPILVGELTDFSEDFSEAVGKAIDAPTGKIVLHGSAEHFQRVLCDEQGIDNSIEARTRGQQCSLRAGRNVPRL
jgi:hypothetical protein